MTARKLIAEIPAGKCPAGYRSIRCFAAALLLLLSGCPKPATEQEGLSAPALSRQYRNDSLTVIVSVSETNIPTSGKIQLELEVHAPPATEVLFPDIGSRIEPFAVADGYEEPLQRLPNGKHLYRRVWTLLPSLPGESVFQPMEISAGSVSIKTDPVTVLVTSLLPRDLSTFDIRDIAAPVDLLPEEKRKKTRWVILSAVLAALALPLLLKRVCRPKQPIVPAAHETAFRALNELPADELERIHTLTEILLTFIGRRFNLPASTRTLREILPLLPGVIPQEHLEPLESVLRDSEQVRFSAKVPAGFADELGDYVHTFVETMKEEPCD